MALEVVGIDFDDVLFPFVSECCAFDNAKYGTVFDYKQKEGFRMYHLWKCSEEEEIRRVFDFYLSTHHADVEPIKGASEAVKKLREKYELLIITARPAEVAHATLPWIEKHFPNLFREVYFLNHYAKNDWSKTKGDVCKELGVKIFIEDSLHNARDISLCEIPVFLFDDYSNQVPDDELPPMVTRVFSWDEITKRLL